MESRIVRAIDPGHVPAYPGLVVGDVRLSVGHQIGVGAFSTVFQARDEWGQALVLKIYRAGVSSRMWRNEAVQLQRFRSPHVVHLQSAFEHEGRGHLLLERCGVALGQCRFRHPAAREAAVLFVAARLLQALHLVHRSGHVHGDVNPQNVLLETGAGQRGLVSLKLADFASCGPLADFLAAPPPMAHWVPPPEYHDRALGPMGPAIDVYHAALVLFGMFGDTPARYAPAQVLQDRPRHDALVHASPLARALAPALALQPRQRPEALPLWRALRAAEREMHAPRGEAQRPPADAPSVPVAAPAAFPGVPA